MLLFLVQMARGCEPVDVAALMDKVGRSLDEGDPEAGLDALKAAWTALPDACGAVAAGDIALLTQRAGALARDLHQAEASDRWFEWSCLMAPDATVPASLGPTAATHVQDACRRVAERATGEILVESPVNLDGRPRDTGSRVRVPTGVHLLAWEAGGEWHGRWQTVEDGALVGLPSGAVIQDSPAPKAKPQPKLGAPVALVATGVGVAGAGVAVYQLLFANRWTQACIGHGFDLAADGWTPCEDKLGVDLSTGYYGGIGLIAGGAAISLVGVGLGVHAFASPTSAGATLTLPI